MIILENIKDKLPHLPKEAGVYLMKDKQGTIIYVGKAKSLRSRVKSYFQDFQKLSSKTQSLVEKITDFEVILSENEVAALLLERTLIKHHKPYFNILLRDDKEYPLLRIDFKEKWPVIYKVRRRKEDGAYYLGPFVNGAGLNEMLHVIRKIFPLVKCKPHEFANAKRPCNYYHMKMCLGPCTLPVDRELYIQTVKNAILFLEGKNTELTRTLQQKMKDAAAGEDYDLAAKYRDQLHTLDTLTVKQVAFAQVVKNADVVSLTLSPDKDLICFHVLMIRDRKILARENFILPFQVETEQEAMNSFLLQYYDGREAPRLILLSHDIEQKEEMAQVIAGENNPRTEILVPIKGEKKSLVDLSLKNAQFALQEEVRMKKASSTVLEDIKKFLHLEHMPHRIECIDISNFQGSAIVASNVVFIDAKPAKSEYRRYKIKNVDTQNDFASVYEVVSRRVRRMYEEDDAPDLIVIDGGRAQLNSALKAYEDISKNFPATSKTISFIGLAKSRLESSGEHNYESSNDFQRTFERIVLPGISEDLILPPATPIFRVLTQLRDEAHRFAITYHRQKRDRQTLTSDIVKIPGIGSKSQKKLLEYFGTYEAIKTATLEQLLLTPGINKTQAEKIYSHFSEQGS